MLIHLTKRSLADWTLKALLSKVRQGFFSRAGDCRLPLSAPITLPSVPRCSSNAQAERGFSLATSLLPCCFIHRAQGSFAKSSVVDLRRQTALQIHQNSVRLNDILLCRLANRKENSGGSALKPRVFGQISCSVSRRDPLKCLLSSRGPPEEMLLSYAHNQAHTYACFYTQAHTLRVNGREGFKQQAPVCITGRVLMALMVRITVPL